MIKNLAKYFKPEYRISLASATYNRVDADLPEDTEYKLSRTETIEANYNEDIVKVSLSTSLEFEPADIFELTVVFEALLKLEEDKKDEIDWKNVNLAEEFKRNGQFIMNNLASRRALLIAQITSSWGQAPIMVPATMIQED